MRNRAGNKETFTHSIKTLDMTRCGIILISSWAFDEFTIEFLDLRENSLYYIPAMQEGFPYPSVVDIRFNKIQCNCASLWLKNHLDKKASISKSEIRVTHCLDVLWNTSVELLTVPDSMFICELPCSLQMQQQCNIEHRCYGLHLELHAVVCISSFNTNELLSSLIKSVYQIHASGFNFSTLSLPFVKPHNLTHLNLTSCNISVIPETAFIYTPQLQILVLSHNAITNLASTTFHPLFWLKYLDLSSNHLLSFTAELILPLSHPETIYLHDNKLKQLSMETLAEFAFLLALSLYDNPWVCDCNNTFGHWIVEQHRKPFLLSPETIKCDGKDVPVMLSNVTCTSLSTIHVHHGSKAATLVSSVLASVLVVILVVCILLYKYRFTLSVVAFIYMPQCTRRRTEDDDV